VEILQRGCLEAAGQRPLFPNIEIVPNGPLCPSYAGCWEDDDMAAFEEWLRQDLRYWDAVNGLCLPPEPLDGGLP
jgi:hypothetical protein